MEPARHVMTCTLDAARQTTGRGVGTGVGGRARAGGQARGWGVLCERTKGKGGLWAIFRSSHSQVFDQLLNL